MYIYIVCSLYRYVYVCGVVAMKVGENSGLKIERKLSSNLSILLFLSVYKLIKNMETHMH